MDSNTPTSWYFENYVEVVGNFFPHPASGYYTGWKFNEATGLYPFEGESFIVLSTGDWPESSSYSKIWQTITVGEGETLTGVYFFGTCDYWDYNDFSYIKLIPLRDDLEHEEIIIAQESLKSVGGDYTSLGGWKRFAYTFDASEAGKYQLTIFVSDYRDNAWDSYLAVDAIKLCHNPPENGELNCDCTVNFEDFAIMVSDWLYDCNDPIFYNDPNTNCLLGTDLSGNGLVELNDLRIIAENWLLGIKEE
ncbi:MAG: hypothetical protein A2Y10_10885 [Planctomycetes bacterium GWF2_41_51]|nr:MAG: hypothetical protein A2Y10_10885 [Planctomycetes bacterium GWF2_41_51]HBG28448.1 hypothetical protein [Phycisphaerales bacterium]